MSKHVLPVVVLLVAACATADEPPTPEVVPPEPDPVVVQQDEPASVVPETEPAAEPEAPAEPVAAEPEDPAVPAPRPRSTVEMSKPLPRPEGNILGTRAYPPTETEAGFAAKLPDDERVTGNMFQDYSIAGKVGKYVGWFGIVRGIREDAENDRTRMLVEMKYFDGLTDLHIQCVSFNGAGDFVVILEGRGHKVKPVSLVKAYGKVVSEQDGVPRLEADYMRVWDQGLFTFIMAYGKQKGNTEFRQLNVIDLEDMYSPYPNERYYRLRLGRRALFESGIVEVP